MERSPDEEICQGNSSSFIEINENWLTFLFKTNLGYQMSEITDKEEDQHLG